MKIKIGKSYRNRSRGVVKIVSLYPIKSSKYKYKGDDGTSYTEEGRFLTARISPLDLIEEVYVPLSLEVGGIYRDGLGRLVHIDRKRVITKEDMNELDSYRTHGKLSDVGSFMYRARHRYGTFSETYYYNYFYSNGVRSIKNMKASLGDLVEFIGIFKPIEASASSFIEGHADNEEDKKALRELLEDYLKGADTSKKPWWKIW